MRPFDDLRSELDRGGDGLIDQSVRSDNGRVSRTGTPEVIYAARKSIEQVMSGIDSMIGIHGRVVVSQIPPGMVNELRGDSRPSSPWRSLTGSAQPSWH